MAATMPIQGNDMAAGAAVTGMAGEFRMFPLEVQVSR